MAAAAKGSAAQPSVTAAVCSFKFEPIMSDTTGEIAEFDVPTTNLVDPSVSFV